MKFTLNTKQKAFSQLGVGTHNDMLCVVRVLQALGSIPVVDVYTCQPKHKIADIFNLPEWAKRYAIKRAPCIGVMTPNSYQLLLVEAPPVPDAELRSAVRWKVQDLIDFHIDDAIVDVFE
jgi:MSHA biogenesis protein MshI